MCFSWSLCSLAGGLRVSDVTLKEFEILDLELEGLDEVTAYVTKLRFPCVVMRNDNKTLYARFYTNSGESLQFELSEWTGFLAESLY